MTDRLSEEHIFLSLRLQGVLSPRIRFYYFHCGSLLDPHIHFRLLIISKAAYTGRFPGAARSTHRRLQRRKIIICFLVLDGDKVLRKLVRIVKVSKLSFRAAGAAARALDLVHVTEELSFQDRVAIRCRFQPHRQMLMIFSELHWVRQLLLYHIALIRWWPRHTHINVSVEQIARQRR